MRKKKMDLEVDKLYRINSHYITIRIILSGVLINFLRKRTRDKSCTAILISNWRFGYNTLKEIPVRILRKRKAYIFLTDILKKRKIPFCWDKLKGMILVYQKWRFTVNSIEKVNNFLLKHKLTLDGIQEMMETENKSDQICYLTEKNKKRLKEQTAQHNFHKNGIKIFNMEY